MKLLAYDVTIVISDPNDGDVNVTFALADVPRETLLEAQFHLREFIHLLEDAVSN